MSRLSPAQRGALDHVREMADGARTASLARIAAALPQPDMTAAMLANVRARGRVAIHFHPDRLLADGRSVACALLDEGRYRSQFETRMSNGGLTAVPGGDRDLWEAELFGDAYQDSSVTSAERPKYGALDLFRHADGAAPRFGSCFLRLTEEAMGRSTFCFGDSHTWPSDTGTLDTFEPVLAGLLEAVAKGECALGFPTLDVAALTTLLASPPYERGVHGRTLDEYIEVQVHSELKLDQDVELLVADPSFRGTETGAVLAELCARYDVPLTWHPGFTLAIDDVPDDFRGPAMPPLARRLQRQFDATSLTAELIGRASVTVHTHPVRWADWGTPAKTLQHLKQLWHVLVQYGGAA